MADDDLPDTTNLFALPARPADLRPKGTAPIELVIDNTGEWCRHGAILVNNHQRSVSCRSCKAPLDAFDVLFRYTREWDSVSYDMKNLRKDTAGASSRLELLKRLESNTKARLQKRGVARLSAYQLDRLVEYARERHPEATLEHVRLELECASPLRKLRIAAKALEDGLGLDAVELAEDALAVLRASFEAAKGGPT